MTAVQLTNNSQRLFDKKKAEPGSWCKKEFFHWPLIQDQKLPDCFCKLSSKTPFKLLFLKIKQILHQFCFITQLGIHTGKHGL